MNDMTHDVTPLLVFMLDGYLQMAAASPESRFCKLSTSCEDCKARYPILNDTCEQVWMELPRVFLGVLNANMKEAEP